MNEFQIINNLKKIVKNQAALNLNDDVFFDKKNSLVASIDTYNEGVHFLNFRKPDLIIKKIIRSSISDIISKGVDPKYLLITFSGTKKHLNKKNIKLILNSIKQEQKKYNFSLIGGDTTKSKNLSFTVCVFGFSKRIIKRNNCFKNDDIYITGNIGDSSVGLDFLTKRIKSNINYKNFFIEKYFKPNISYGFHKELHRFATSSMDISDGLLLDLNKLIGNKKLKFLIDYNKLPISFNFQKLFKHKKTSINNYLFKGDDYQILFTANIRFRKIIDVTSKKWNQKVTKIGSITNNKDNYMMLNTKFKKITDYQGYIHNFY